MAVSVGLAAGIGMLMIAGIMTLIFNYVFLTLWAVNCGGYDEAKQSVRKSRSEEDEPEPGVFR